MVVAAEPQPITVAYPPRGAATVWMDKSAPPAEAASALLGRSRTRILLALDNPISAAELAQTTSLSAPAVSQHLAVLRRAGLVESRKSGRTVWSVRTRLGSELLDACSP
jgi:DNA-binding transcriptional ArsR family regulator